MRALFYAGLFSLAISFKVCAQSADDAMTDNDVSTRAVSSEQLPDSPIQRAVALLNNGKLQDARELLAPLRQGPVPDMEVLFLSGMIYEKAGEFANAAAEFRLMLAREPTSPRPRLELARSLFLMKDYPGANYNFQQLMAADIPPMVRRNIEKFMVQIREQVPTFSIDLEMVRDTNPAQLTNSNSVVIGGLNYKLNTTAPSKAVTGVRANVNGRLPLPSDPSIYGSLGIQLWEFPGKTMDQVYFQGTLGKSTTLGSHTLSAEIGAHQFEYQWKPLYQGPVFRLLDYYRQQPTLAWQADLERRVTHYSNYSYLDGWQQIASLSGIYSPSIDNRLEGGVNFIYSKAEDPSYSFENPNVFARISHEWKGGLITGANIQYGVSTYKEADPFFGVKREDYDARGELSVLNRQWQINQFSPRLIIGYINHHSNIDLNAYKRAYVNLGASRDF